MEKIYCLNRSGNGLSYQLRVFLILRGRLLVDTYYLLSTLNKIRIIYFVMNKLYKKLIYFTLSYGDMNLIKDEILNQNMHYH